MNYSNTTVCRRTARVHLIKKMKRTKEITETNMKAGMVRPSHAHGVYSADNSALSSQDVVNITEERSGHADVDTMAPWAARAEASFKAVKKKKTLPLLDMPRPILDNHRAMICGLTMNLG